MKKKRTPTPLHHDRVPTLQESIISRVNADHTVSVVNLDLDDTSYSIDGIAGEIFAAIDGKRSIGAIKKRIMKKHQPPAKQFEKDFIQFVQELKSENLIDL